MQEPAGAGDSRTCGVAHSILIICVEFHYLPTSLNTFQSEHIILTSTGWVLLKRGRKPPRLTTFTAGQSRLEGARFSFGERGWGTTAVVVSPSEQGPQPWLSFRSVGLNEGNNKGSVVDRGSGSGERERRRGRRRRRGGIGWRWCGLQSHLPAVSSRQTLPCCVLARASVVVSPDAPTA